MNEKIFLVGIDKQGDEMNLQITEYQLILLINILWTQRRNKLLGARLIDFYKDLSTEAEHEIQKMGIPLDHVNKLLKKWRIHE